MHTDPEFARAAGFPAPILHDLCSFGIVLRELTDALLGGDAARVGETIRVRGWRNDGRPDRIVGSAVVAAGDREGAPVLDDVVLDVIDAPMSSAGG